MTRVANTSVDQLFESLYERLRVFAAGITKDNEEARDIVQEAFIKLLNRVRSFDHFKQIEAFLFITVRNGCIDFLRKQKTRSQREVGLIDDIHDREANPNDLLDADFIAALHDKIGSLPGRSGEVIILFYLKSLKSKEIASKMGISNKAVERLLSRARDMLRKNIINIE